MWRQERYPEGCQTRTGGDRGRGRGPAGGKTGLEGVGERRGEERREGKESKEEWWRRRGEKKLKETHRSQSSPRNLEN